MTIDEELESVSEELEYLKSLERDLEEELEETREAIEIVKQRFSTLNSKTDQYPKD